MKVQTLSVVIGGNACNAYCPYCVAKLTGNCKGLKSTDPMDVNRRNFHKACRLAQMSGVNTVLLTGKGEPTLYPKYITRCLELLQKWDFPLIELQTNGTKFGVLEDDLKDWYDLGLNTISLSCVDWDRQNNVDVFGIDIRLEQNIELLHKLGFSVRISCIMMKGLIDSILKIYRFVDWCKERNVEQLTIRMLGNLSEEEVKDDDNKKQIYEWIEKHQLDWNTYDYIYNHFNSRHDILLQLAHGAIVYDINGQNLSLNTCLTESSNPDDIRQLIFSPDGHLRYSWTRDGAILF